MAPGNSFRTSMQFLWFQLEVTRLMAGLECSWSGDGPSFFVLVPLLKRRIFHPLAARSCSILVSSLLCVVPSDQTTDTSQVDENTPSKILSLCDQRKPPRLPHGSPDSCIDTTTGVEFLKLALPLQKCWWHHTLQLPGKGAAGKVATQSAAWQEGEPGVRHQHITKALCIPEPNKLQQRFICILTNKRSGAKL